MEANILKEIRGAVGKEKEWVWMPTGGLLLEAFYGRHSPKIAEWLRECVAEIDHLTAKPESAKLTYCQKCRTIVPVAIGDSLLDLPCCKLSGVKAENEKLRAALTAGKEFLCHTPHCACVEDYYRACDCGVTRAKELARAALSGKKEMNSDV